MLYRLIKLMIESGEIEGISRKVDLFYLNGSIKEEEYQELVALLREKEGK